MKSTVIKFNDSQVKLKSLLVLLSRVNWDSFRIDLRALDSDASEIQIFFNRIPNLPVPDDLIFIRRFLHSTRIAVEAIIKLFYRYARLNDKFLLTGSYTAKREFLHYSADELRHLNTAVDNLRKVLHYLVQEKSPISCTHESELYNMLGLSPSEFLIDLAQLFKRASLIFNITIPLDSMKVIVKNASNGISKSNKKLNAFHSFAQILRKSNSKYPFPAIAPGGAQYLIKKLNLSLDKSHSINRGALFISSAFFRLHYNEFVLFDCSDDFVLSIKTHTGIAYADHNGKYPSGYSSSLNSTVKIRDSHIVLPKLNKKGAFSAVYPTISEVKLQQILIADFTGLFWNTYETKKKARTFKFPSWFSPTKDKIFAQVSGSKPVKLNWRVSNISKLQEIKVSPEIKLSILYRTIGRIEPSY